MSSVAETIAKAKEAATQVAAQVAAPTPGTALASPGNFSLESFLDKASLEVDGWMKVEKIAGFGFGKQPKAYVKEFDAVIRIDELVPLKGVRVGAPGALPNYYTSSDGQTCRETGQPWQSVIAMAKQADPNTKGDYNRFDVPLELVKDTADGKKGERYGFSTSITQYEPLRKAIADLAKAENGNIRGRAFVFTVRHKVESNGSFQWGVAEFVNPRPYVA
jgi:hypothetical protein